MTACRAALAHGRWHFQHGPIDLVIGADGPADAVAAASERAWTRFRTILDELVAELPGLRAPIAADASCVLRGTVARRMWAACHPHAADAFITPMAAVAGAVAEEVLAAYADPRIERAWVNNGGDVALRLQPGRRFEVGLLADLARFDPARGPRLDGRFWLDADRPVRGLATSGWRGRSHSRGIADSVTVLAATASMADAAATIVANAVDLDDPRIVRAPACELKDDSDLGALLVTLEVPVLGPSAVEAALEAGVARALRLQRSGLIDSAVLVCQRRMRIVAPLELSALAGGASAARAAGGADAPGDHATRPRNLTCSGRTQADHAAHPAIPKPSGILQEHDDAAASCSAVTHRDTHRDMQRAACNATPRSRHAARHHATPARDAGPQRTVVA